MYLIIFSLKFFFLYQFTITTICNKYNIQLHNIHKTCFLLYMGGIAKTYLRVKFLRDRFIAITGNKNIIVDKQNGMYLPFLLDFSLSVKHSHQLLFQTLTTCRHSFVNTFEKKFFS